MLLATGRPGKDRAVQLAEVEQRKRRICEEESSFKAWSDISVLHHAMWGNDSDERRAPKNDFAVQCVCAVVYVIQM